MTLLLLGIGVLLLGTPRWLTPLGRRLNPRERVRLSMLGLVLGAMVVELALAFLALPTVLRALGVDSLAVACRRWLGDLAPGGLQVGWSAAALALASPFLARRGWRRATTAADEMRVEPTLGVHHRTAGLDVVELPTEVPLAYSVDGDIPQIVVSQGLAARLSGAELDAVVRHELAHLRRRDGRALGRLAAIEAVLPALRWATQPVRVAIERAADEAATGHDAVARSTLVSALLRVAVPDELPAFISGFTSRSGVVERVSGLLDPAPQPTGRQRTTARLALLGCATTGVVVVGGWAVEAHMMLSMVGVCRM